MKTTNTSLQLAYKPTILNLANLFKLHTKYLSWFCAVGIMWLVWQISPAPPLDQRGVYFLATLAAAVTLWISNAFDEYVVALLLLLCWIFLNLVPIKIALSGFSDPSWFFVLGALGMGAAVSKTGLLARLATRLLKVINDDRRALSWLVAGMGVLITPLLPRIMPRIVVVAPVANAIANGLGFKPRSNESASLSLAAFTGCTVLTFMFMTGGTYCLVGWSLLPDAAKAEFGWGTWTLAALPAGIFTILFLLVGINFLFSAREVDSEDLKPMPDLSNGDPLTRQEVLSMAIVGCALLGWVSKPLHGIGEPWIAMTALFFFLATDVLDKNSFKNNIEWGFLVFFGVSYSLASIASHLKIDLWLMNVMDPLVSAVSYHPLAFLLFVLLLVHVLRFFFLSTPAVMVVLIGLTSWAGHNGIHPGVLLLTALMGVEVWFLPYQHIGYALAYGYTKGTAFSHSDGRKLMYLKFIASVIGLVISIPYWQFLGLIR